MPHDPEKVPTGPAADWFYDGKTGEGTTDDQYDETKRRFVESGAPLPWEDQTEEAADE